MLNFDLYNHTRKAFSKKLFKNALKNAEIILIKEKKINSGQKLFIELNLVGNAAITHINKQYRRKNRSTDVISLSYFDRDSKNAFIKRETLGSLKNKSFCRYQKHLIFGLPSFASAKARGARFASATERVSRTFIGEIFICVPYATKQARELGFTLNKELQFLFIHGLLHIFGYDHENPTDKKKMERLTERILV